MSLQTRCINACNLRVVLPPSEVMKVRLKPDSKIFSNMNLTYHSHHHQEKLDSELK